MSRDCVELLVREETGRCDDRQSRRSIRYETTGLVRHEEEKKELREDLLNPSRYTMAVPKVTTLRALGVADQLTPLLYRMNWTVVSPAHGFFITTDNPLVKHTDPKTHHQIYGDGGFINKTAEVLFPLSRQKLLLMTWLNEAPDTIACSRDHAQRLNIRLASQSDRYLYAHLAHKYVQALAAKFKNSRPTMTTEGFGPDKFAEVRVARRRRR